MKLKLIVISLFSTAASLCAQEISMPASRDGNVVKELFFAGLKDKMAENYVNASTNFSKILVLDPKNDAAYFELASLNFRQQKLLDAEVNIKKAIALNSQNVWYLKLQAEIYKRNGNMEALILVFNKLIDLSPDIENYYFDRANAYFIAGKIPESQNAYQQLEQKFGPSKELALAKQRVTMQNGGPQKDDVDKLIADNPTDVKSYLYLSGLLLEKNKNEDALALLQKAKVLEPNNFEIDLAMADVYQSMRKNELAVIHLKNAFAEEAMPVGEKVKIVKAMLPRMNNPLVAKDAIELMEIAIKLHPDDVNVLLLYGNALYHRGSLNAAKEQYKAVVKISEQHYDAWKMILSIESLLGQYDEVIKSGEEALALYPNQAILYYYKAFALHRNGQNAEAALEIKSALQLESDDNDLKSMIFALQAEVLIDQDKLKEADIAFDKAITLAPENYLTLSNYAYYLALRNQNLSKAETLAAKAVKEMPNNASILDTYAMVLFKLGKYDSALSYIEKALQNNEASNPVYLEHYGDILFLKGSIANALEQWQKAKKAGNDSEKLNKKINEKKYIK